MTFTEAVLDGLRLVLVWPAPGYMLLGVAIGMFFGAVPGLGGLVGMAIILPFTFGMEPNVAFAFILGMYAVTTTARHGRPQRYQPPPSPHLERCLLDLHRQHAARQHPVEFVRRP